MEINIHCNCIISLGSGKKKKKKGEGKKKDNIIKKKLCAYKGNQICWQLFEPDGTGSTEKHGRVSAHDPKEGVPRCSQSSTTGNGDGCFSSDSHQCHPLLQAAAPAIK